MADSPALALVSQSLGALPVVQRFLDRLGLDKLLDQYVPQQDRRFHIPPATALAILLRNIILGRRPLYGLQEWAKPYATGPARAPVPARQKASTMTGWAVLSTGFSTRTGHR